MKTIETKNIKIVIADSNHEKLKSEDDERMMSHRGIYNPKTSKNEYIMNSDYYNTPEALATGIIQRVLYDQMILAADDESMGEEEIDRRSYMIGEELMEIFETLSDIL